MVQRSSKHSSLCFMAYSHWQSAGINKQNLQLNITSNSVNQTNICEPRQNQFFKIC